MRLTTTLTQLATELEELASHMGGRQGEVLAAAAAARGAGDAAWRTYYMGHAALTAAAGSGGGDRLSEAAGLFRRAEQRASQAIKAVQVPWIEVLPQSAFAVDAMLYTKACARYAQAVSQVDSQSS